MESIKLNKIVGFFDRHLLLSSFLLLVILGTLLAFYITYARTAHFSFIGGGIHNILFSAKWTILDIWLCVIPLFPISVVLFSFLKRKDSHGSQLSFSSKFLLSSIPAVSIVFLFTFLTIQETPGPYANDPMYLYSIAIFITGVYGVMFGAFFGRHSKTTKLRTLAQSAAVNILMGVYYVLFYLVSHFSI